MFPCPLLNNFHIFKKKTHFHLMVYKKKILFKIQTNIIENYSMFITFQLP